MSAVNTWGPVNSWSSASASGWNKSGAWNGASAGIQVGDSVDDANGDPWLYVGKFFIGDGPRWNDGNSCYIDGTSPPEYESGCVIENAANVNGVQAAEIVFGVITGEEYGTSTSETVVNRQSWYNEFQGVSGASRADSIATSGLYDTAGDLSAYILDGYTAGADTYVFKRDLPTTAVNIESLVLEQFNNSSVTDVELLNTLESLVLEQFNNSSVTDVELLNTLESIVLEQFNNSSVTDVELLNTLESIVLEQINNSSVVLITQVLGQDISGVSFQQFSNVDLVDIDSINNIETIIVEQINNYFAVNVLTNTSVITSIVEQINESSTTDVNPSGGADVIIINSHQLNQIESVTLVQLDHLSVYDIDQLNEIVLIDVELSYSVITDYVHQLNEINLMNIITSTDKISLQGVRLVPILNIFTLSKKTSV
jgi:hypothetical protein